MNIIKKGFGTHEVVCSDCGTWFECERGELCTGRDYYGDEYHYVRCPICGTKLQVFLSGDKGLMD